jgi:hypothetical protein
VIRDPKQLATKAMMEQGFQAIVKTRNGKVRPAFVQGALARIDCGRGNSMWTDAELIRVTGNEVGK